jgi:predicted small metal-binding protein
MKKISCRELGGACDLEFTGDSFEEVGKQSQEHAIKMFQQKDELHLEAAEKMKALMSSPLAMENWMNEKKEYFLNLPDEN